jgi:hypothetical protein
MKISVNIRQIGMDMHKRLFLVLGGITVISGVIVLTLTQVRAVRSNPQESTATPSGLVTAGPTVPIYLPTLPPLTDLAPEVPLTDKTTIIIRHADGEYEAFLLTPDMVEAFLNQLPAGDQLDDLIPPQSLMGHEPPLDSPASGNQTYSSTPSVVIGTPPSPP